MKFICEKADLLAAVGPATYVVAAKNTVAEIEGIHLKTEQNSVVLSAYDLKKGIRATISAEVEEPGCYIINAQKLNQILRLIPEGKVCVEVDAGKMVRITSGKSSFELRAMDGTKFPALPELSGERGFTIPQKVLRRMVAQVNFAVAKEHHMVVLTGSHFIIRENHIRLVACDSHRLAIRDYFNAVENHSVDQATPLDLRFTVAGDTLNELMKMLSDTEETVTILLGRKHVIFSLGKLKFFSRLIDGEYMDYNKFIPQKGSIRAKVNTEAFLSGLERAALITEDRVAGQVRSVVCLHFDEETLEVYATSVAGKANDEIPIEKEGGELLIGFNCRMLLDIVRACSAEQLDLMLDTPRTSMVIRPAVPNEEEDFLFLCLPVQMRD